MCVSVNTPASVPAPLINVSFVEVWEFMCVCVCVCEVSVCSRPCFYMIDHFVFLELLFSLISF